MCPTEIIHRLLDLVSKSINHITHEPTLEAIVKELDDIKIRLERDGLDK